MVAALADSWRVAFSGGRPFAVRAQALAFVLVAILAVGSLGGIAAVGAVRLLGAGTRRPRASAVADRAQRVVPDPTPSRSRLTIAADRTPEPTETPRPSDTPEPSETDRAEPSARRRRDRTRTGDRPRPRSRPRPRTEPASAAEPMAVRRRRAVSGGADDG